MGSARSAFTCFFSADDPLAARKHSQFGPFISAISTPKNGGIAKKLILTIRAIMLGQHIDLVASDFNGTAWRCNNRDKSRQAFAHNAHSSRVLVWGRVCVTVHP